MGLLFGLLLLPAGVVMATLGYAETSGWARAEGKVVEYVVERRGTDSKRLPLVEFTDRDGQPHQFKGTVGGTFSPGVGSTLTVAYDPASPAEARMLWWEQLNYALISLIGLLALVGAWVMFRAKPRPGG